MQYKINLDIEFRKNPHKGLYIALEGIDGSGKTTQAEALESYFLNIGKKVTKTSEPRVDLPGGDVIMQYFKSEISLSAFAFQHLASSNRVINQDQVVIPALKKGRVVITDRCFWSAVPYGLMDQGIYFSRKNADLILVTQSLLSHYNQFIVPDIVFYIDISAETGLNRSLKKKDRRKLDIYEKKEKLEKVVKGYRWLVKKYKSEFLVIDGERKVNDITKSIISHIMNRKLIK